MSKKIEDWKLPVQRGDLHKLCKRIGFKRGQWFEERHTDYFIKLTFGLRLDSKQMEEMWNELPERQLVKIFYEKEKEPYINSVTLKYYIPVNGKEVRYIIECHRECSNQSDFFHWSELVDEFHIAVHLFEDLKDKYPDNQVSLL